MPYITVRSLLQRIIRQRRINFNLGGIVDGSNSIPIEGEHGYTRNLIKLNRSLEQHFTFAEQVATGDYEWSLDFCIFGLSNASRGLLSNPSSNHLGSVYLISSNTLSTKVSSGYRHTSIAPEINIFHTLSVKQTGTNIVIKLNDVVILTIPNTNSGTKYSLIGSGLFFEDNIKAFDGYIKDVHLISGFPENKLFKLNENLVVSNTIVDSNGGSTGTMVNGGSAYSEPFTLNTRTTPHVWSNNGGSIVLPVAGTVSTIQEGEHGYQTNLIKINRSLEQYFTFDEQVATGDFEVNLDFCATVNGTETRVLIGHTTTWQSTVWTNGSSPPKIAARGQGYNHSDTEVPVNVFNNLNIKLTGTSFEVKLNDEVALLINATQGLPTKFNLLGNGLLSSYADRFFEGYIKNVHLISGFPENKLFKLNDTLVGSNSIVDFNGGSAGAMVNGGSAYSERFTLNTGPTPHVYSNDDGSVILPIADTVGTILEGEHGYQRNIIRLNRSLSQYFTFNEQTQQTDDYEIQVDYFHTSTQTGVSALFSSNSNKIPGLCYLYQTGAGYYKNGEDHSNVLTWPSTTTSFSYWHTVNIKSENGTVTLRIDGSVIDSDDMEGLAVIGRIGGLTLSNYGQNYATFEGYIKNFHIISGFSQNKFFKLDEDLIGSNSIADSNGGSAGNAVNLSGTYSERFTLNTSVSPNVYVNDDASISLPIAGT